MRSKEGLTALTLLDITLFYDNLFQNCAEKQYENTILTLQARIQDLEKEKSALGRLVV
jgi:hypothetical protein